MVGNFAFKYLTEHFVYCSYIILFHINFIFVIKNIKFIEE